MFFGQYSENTPSVKELDEPAVWMHSPTVQIETRLLSNHNLLGNENPSPDSALLVPGYGEGRGATTAGLEVLAGLGIPAVAANVNIRQVAPTSRDIEAYVTEFGPMVRQNLISRELQTREDPVFGQSLGAGVLGLAVGQTPELFRDLGLTEPLGMTTFALKEEFPDDEQRRLEFTRRFRNSIYRGVVLDIASIPRKYMALNELIIKQVLGDLVRPPLFREEFAVASSVDTTADVVSHAAKGNKVAIVLGEKDPLIRNSDFCKTIKHYADQYTGAELRKIERNIKIEVTEYQHTFGSWRGGRAHLKAAAEMLGLTRKAEN